MINYMLQPNVRLAVGIMEVLHEHEKEKETDGFRLLYNRLGFHCTSQSRHLRPRNWSVEVLRGCLRSIYDVPRPTSSMDKIMPSMEVILARCHPGCKASEANPNMAGCLSSDVYLCWALGQFIPDPMYIVLLLFGHSSQY